MNIVASLNGQIFITNKQDSDARLAALRQSSGNTQTWRTCFDCLDEDDSDAWIRTNSQ